MDNTFKDRLLYLRNKKNVSQINLATFCEVSQETISSYETGKNMASCDVLVRIANYLGTSTDYLLGRIDRDVSIYQLTPNGITDEEAEIISNYKNLSIEDKAKVRGYIEALKK